MKPKPTHADLAGSRYLALQRLARAQKRTTAELLQFYVLESFLRRLVRSRHDHTLVLKGGMLLAAFDLRRATRDVDVLALNTDNDPACRPATDRRCDFGRGGRRRGVSAGHDHRCGDPRR